MSQSIWATVLAIAVYVSSTVGGKEAPVQPSAPAPAQVSQETKEIKYAVISREAASLRKEAQGSSEILQTLPKGTTVTVLSSNDEWMKVQTPDGQTGWVAPWMTKSSIAAPSRSGSGTEVLAYYAKSTTSDTRGYKSFAGNLDTITSVAPFSFRVDAHGNVSGSHDENLAKLAKSRGIETLAVVTNIQGSNFSKKVIHELLNSKTARSRAVNGILRLVQEKGYTGVNIDFEGVPPGDRAELTAFFRELSSAFRAKNLLVTASIPAKTKEDKRSAWAGAYDYPAIAPYLDRVMIMTYDEHYKDGPPGPVASQNWVENVVRYAVKSFPPQRIMMGIAAYGYDWTARSGRALNLTGIQNIIDKYKIIPKWHSSYQVPYFTYSQSGTRHEVWYENRYSTAAKMRLVDQYGLRGVAVWRLGYEDPGIWQVL